MEPHVMVHKANQIALFFAAYSHEEAVAGTANHIKMYWEPRMRRQIYRYVADGGEGLNAVALEAVQRLAAAEADAGVKG
jgi:formate dehydrogenase subunit delta